ncbi:MAG: ATP-binding cassette domain-containing protein [Deltaproteobacteria bacterium]|nr:ATP-binding cassette domain-containing protein [Deltaproteobacteria bacterium]
MVEVSHLTKSYGEFRAIRDVSFTARRGETLGFLGPNGAGKTTTMRILAGFMLPSEGTATIEGYDVCRDSREARKRIGYLPENPPLYPDMTVRSFLTFAGSIKGVRTRELRRTLEGILEKCALTEVSSRLIKHLSRGYRQRLGLAQALIHNPPVLILDEPTLGLDPKQIVEIRGLIKELSGDRAVILSTHLLPEVSQLCDKVVIINDGKIAVEKSLEDLTRGSTLEEVFLLHIAKDTIELDSPVEEGELP